jgi:hypothetical protein
MPAYRAGRISGRFSSDKAEPGQTYERAQPDRSQAEIEIEGWLRNVPQQ